LIAFTVQDSVPAALLLYCKKMEQALQRKKAGLDPDVFNLMPRETMASLLDAESDSTRKIARMIKQRVNDDDITI